MKAQQFVQCLKSNGIDSYYGVPDSLLKSICAYIADNADSQHNIITANEGSAIGLACGHYLATGRPALVYMQNSGQGNVVNPLLSLMDEDVYSIPVLLLIGWRGEPGIPDEPQHVKQGKVTIDLLETMGVAHAVISDNDDEALAQINEACAYMKRMKRPYALVARKKTFEAYSLQNKRVSNAEMSREQAICTVAAALQPDDIVVSTTGQISRELYEFRTACNSSHQSDFLTVGAMGHSSSIAMGVALKKKERRVVCMDGDGAFLMHMGAAAIVGNAGLTNMRHVIFNNAAHDSVGSQPTVADKLDFAGIVKSCGYTGYYKADTEKELKEILPVFLETPGTTLLEVSVRCGSRADLGRPKERPWENKESFMRFVEEPKSIVAPGAAKQLAQFVANKGWKRLLVFSTNRRLQAMPHIISELEEKCAVKYYTAISPNPSASEIDKAVSECGDAVDAIVAIGGGSVIDFAKAYRVCRDNEVAVEEYFNSRPPLIRNTPLVAIPTTAGTGSEATRFAVVYVHNEKCSLDSSAVIPDYAIVDSELMRDAPAYLKASCGMDAMAQCLEGYWAKNATAESDAYALEALQLCRDNLEHYVNTAETVYADNMALAANLAGKCINISRTTAAHALSYKITQLYGLPHGHAVALSLPGLAAHHATVAEQGTVLHEKMQKLASLLSIETGEWESWFHSLYARIGLSHDLQELGITSTVEIVNGVNTERLSNNPVSLSVENLQAIIH